MADIFDYSSQTTAFKLRKLIRFVRLHGVDRTLTKIRSKLHLKKKLSVLPEVKHHASSDASVGIVGCGDYAYMTIAYYLRKQYGPIMRGCMDIEVCRAASLYESYAMDYYTDDVDRLLDDGAIGIVYVASNHASHAEYAIKTLEAGKNVHIEKPHAINREQLSRLCGRIHNQGGKVFLGYNRRRSPLFHEMMDALDREGGPMMMSFFVTGHPIPKDHWYNDPREGGRVLGNLCHWIDLAYQMAPRSNRYPIQINPARRFEEAHEDAVAVTLMFGDGSTAAITFSAKGAAFEGIREVVCVQRGDVFITVRDFQFMTIDRDWRRKTRVLRHRDYGHKRNILNSYEASIDPSLKGESQRSVWEVGELVIAVKEALESGNPKTVEPFDPAFMA